MASREGKDCWLLPCTALVLVLCTAARNEPLLTTPLLLLVHTAISSSKVRLREHKAFWLCLRDVDHVCPTPLHNLLHVVRISILSLRSLKLCGALV